MVMERSFPRNIPPDIAENFYKNSQHLKDMKFVQQMKDDYKKRLLAKQDLYLFLKIQTNFIIIFLNMIDLLNLKNYIYMNWV